MAGLTEKCIWGETSKDMQNRGEQVPETFKPCLSLFCVGCESYSPVNIERYLAAKRKQTQGGERQNA